MQLQVGSALRPASGERISGDVCAAVPFAEGTLFCLADGLGHGPEAHAVAEAACGYARAHVGEPLQTLLRGMDRALSGTRGAAVSLLSLLTQERRALFVGVGNVELRALARTRIAPPTSPGVVGRRMRELRVWEYPLAAGDLIVLMTDGISGYVELEALARLDPQAMAEELIARHHQPHDDACCVVIRVREGPG